MQALDVTDGVLPILGLTPFLGRWFTLVDDSTGGPDTVMLSYDYWQNTLARIDPSRGEPFEWTAKRARSSG